jgi:biopolymer transport protein ExbD
MRIPRRPRPEPHVPFISLADIAWQLIIFFLITSTFIRNESLNIELPSSSAEAGIEQQEDTLTVQAGEATLTLNGETLVLDELEARLRAALAGRSGDAQRAVVLLPGDDLTFERNLLILRAIKQAGGVPAIMQESEGDG